MSEQVRLAAAHMVKQARERGCCCAPAVTFAGWREGPNGLPAPMLVAMHATWCPLLRATEGTRPRMRFVEPDSSESA